MEISSKEQKIIGIFLDTTGSLQSSDVHQKLVAEGDQSSLVTVKRLLSQMADRGLLAVSGAGRSSSYDLGITGRVHAAINAHAYGAIEPDQRIGQKRYNADLFAHMPAELFSDREAAVLEAATTEYHQRTRDISPTLAHKELERLVIELSWKSSRIEGNTYTLLDTEKLILDHIEAPGHTRDEAVMILNHKAAFSFVREQTASFAVLTRPLIEELHTILVKDLGVGRGLRAHAVGITGSSYQPLATVHQLREALDEFIAAINRVESPYAKALLALGGISYIQPFEDGNKRTARLLANAILMAHSCAPLSYRSVVEEEYREAILVFYGINSLVPFKKIFIEQYDFAARNYAVAP